MIPFKKITKADFDSIVDYFEGEKRERVRRALQHYCADADHDIFVADVEGMLVLRQEVAKLYVYSMPTLRPGLSIRTMRMVLMQMMEAASVMNYDWLVVGIRMHEKADVKAALPQHFKFAGEEKYSYLSLVRMCKRITEEPSIVAVPVTTLSDSLFANNEDMVPAP